MTIKTSKRTIKKKSKVPLKTSDRKLKEKEYNDHLIIFQEDPHLDLPEFRNEKGIDSEEEKEE